MTNGSQRRHSRQPVIDALLVETTLRARTVPTTNTLCQVAAVSGGDDRTSLNAQIAEAYRAVASASLERMLLKQRFGGGRPAAYWADLHHVGGEVLVRREGVETVRLADCLRNLSTLNATVASRSVLWLLQEVVISLPLVVQSTGREIHSTRFVFARDRSDALVTQAASLVRRPGPNSRLVESIAVDVATGLPARFGGSDRQADALPSWEQLRSAAVRAARAFPANSEVEWEVVLSPDGPVVVGSRMTTA